jgi:hypothetical protein
MGWREGSCEKHREEKVSGVALPLKEGVLLHKDSIN